MIQPQQLTPPKNREMRGRGFEDMKEPSARLSITQVLLQNTSLPMIFKFHGAEYGMYNKRFEKDNKERLRVSHCLASGNTAENAGFSKEPDRSDETKDGQPSRGP